MEVKEKQPNEEQKAKERIVRILSKDIEGGMKIYAGLTKIKGISWAMSNYICKKMGLDKPKMVGLMDDAEIEKITKFVKELKSIEEKYLMNRQKDIESGEDKHLVVSDLDLQKEFDIKRLRKIKSYRGLRHGANLPTRGQRTRGNFRKNRSKGSGIKKKVVKKE